MRKILLLLVAICAGYSAMASATVTQKEWRWRNDDGDESSATWKAPQEQAASVNRCTQTGQNIRLRINMLVNPDPADTVNATHTSVTQPYLSYSTSPAGPWTLITTTSSDFVVSVSPNVTNGTPTNQQLTSSDGVPGQGAIVDAATTGFLVFNTPIDVVTRREYEWVIQPTAAAQATTYYFTFGEADDHPNVLPSLTLYGGPTALTQNVSTCGSYTSPSGNYTWMASGTYNDTIPNAAGCDSVITTNLTINTSTFHSMTASACNSYVSPSGNYNWTASGTYNDTIPNAAGCDSILTIDLTINVSTFHSMTATACNSYVSPSGNYTWTASGTYNDTIPNAAGCDSIITIDLAIQNTFHSMTASACNSYVSPSGNYTWTASGTYNDTIPNAAGCDSIITIDLAIQNTFRSMTASACNSYVSPSGNYTWTASGTYNDTIPNAAGCDSIITIDLAIQNTFHSMAATACNSYVSPSGNYTWTTSGMYNDTIPNAAGCDSIITIDLAIQNTFHSMTATACNSYVSPSGNYTWTASGMYNDTIPNAAGCDSVITIDLAILSTFHSMTASACNSYVSPSGNYTWTASGTYNDTIPNAAGCDSIITIDLAIQNTFHSMTASACNSYVSPSGNYTWTASGAYNDTIPNAAGCDSIITIDLTINQVNTATSVSGLTISAAAGAGSYQWINCDDLSEIQGATNATFTATANGSYAVVISDNSCQDTSSCTDITTVGLENLQHAPVVTVAPNPTNGLFSVQFTGSAAIELIVLDLQGKTVFTGANIASETQIDLSSVENGVYMLQIRTGNGTAVQRIVKQ